LESAPVDRRWHLLEAYSVEGASARCLAEPVGAPTDDGFPLRLAPYSRSAPSRAPKEDTAPEAVLRTSSHTHPSLTKKPSRALAGEEKPEAHVGRHLGGGKYRLDALVGVGGMGAVYRAYHRDLAKVVAVKVLHASFRRDPGFSRRFHAEARTMSRIDHPNVRRVLDFGEEDDGILYIAMEFLDGTDLGTIVEQGGPFDLERLVNVMIQITAGLGHVHRHEIIHRDVKARNIVVISGVHDDHDQPMEVVKVCDFGIALTSG